MTVHKEVREESNTFSTTLFCACGWDTGEWPCDGSAEYRMYLHIAGHENEGESNDE